MNKQELFQQHGFFIKETDTTLLTALTTHFSGLSRTLGRKAIQAGLVKVDGIVTKTPQQSIKTVVQVDCDFRHGIEKPFQLARFAPPEGDLPFSVLHCDEEIVIVNKMPGFLSTPTFKDERGAVSEFLRRWLRAQGDKRPFTAYVHRLDKETSGCLCFARNRRSQKFLSIQFAKHTARRRYRCIVVGGPRNDRDTLRNRIGRGHDGRRSIVNDKKPGKDAITHFEVVQRLKNATELKLRLETGRTHQIRIHLAHIGCPIMGDPVYGEPKSSSQKAERMMLHANQLELDHPTTGQRMAISAPLPSQFTTIRSKLAGT